MALFINELRPLTRLIIEIRAKELLKENGLAWDPEIMNEKIVNLYGTDNDITYGTIKMDDLLIISNGEYLEVIP